MRNDKPEHATRAFYDGWLAGFEHSQGVEALRRIDDILRHGTSNHVERASFWQGYRAGALARRERVGAILRADGIRPPTSIVVAA